MISFFACLGALILSYFTYAKYVERVFGPTSTPTPAIRFANGVDYVPMPLWRMVLVQLLNIAGLGPVFGAIAGALWGPSVFLCIKLMGKISHSFMIKYSRQVLITVAFVTLDKSYFLICYEFQNL